MTKYLKIILIIAIAISLAKLEYNRDVISGLVTGVPIGAMLTVLKIGGLK